MEFTPLQRKIVDGFRRTRLVRDFYLTGGTLLAVRYLGHRRSYDLDFFSNHPFTLTQVEKEIIKLIDHAKLTINEVRHVADRWEWELSDQSDRTKLELVWYDFKSLRPHRYWQGIAVDTLPDIAANKMMALLERHEPKDIFDLYHIIKKKRWTVAHLTRLLKQKFGLPITPQTFYSEAERALKRLEAVRGMLLTEDPKQQDEQLTEIHTYFDLQAWRYLRSRFGR